MTITLGEAIETVVEYTFSDSCILDTTLRDALKLLIEAGKRIQAKRLDHWVLITPPLPGETPK